MRIGITYMCIQLATKFGEPQTGGPSGLRRPGGDQPKSMVKKTRESRDRKVAIGRDWELVVLATCSGSAIVSGGVRKRQSTFTVVAQSMNQPAPPRCFRGMWRCNQSSEGQICAGRRVAVREKGSLRLPEVWSW